MTHGTYSGYNHHHCRCEACGLAYFRYMKRIRMSGQSRRIDATGTARRLRALVAIGWTFDDLAHQLGYASKGSLRNITARRYVSPATEKRVRALYDRLSMTHGPSSRSRAIARGRGWAPPLAWDDDSIDDPAAEPNVGKADGRAGIHADDIAWACRYERHTWDTLAARFGINPRSLRTVLRRAGMHDLQARITDWSTEAAA